MVWSPTWQATNVRPVLSNLLAFITAHQVEALAWAEPTKTLAPLTLYPTAEMLLASEIKTLPHFGIVKRRLVAGEDDAGLKIRYELMAQLEVGASYTVATRSASLLTLQKDTDNYTYALESMILNMKPEALFAGITGGGPLFRSVQSSDPLEVAISDTKALFNVQMQIVLEFLE